MDGGGQHPPLSTGVDMAQKAGNKGNDDQQYSGTLLFHIYFTD